MLACSICLEDKPVFACSYCSSQACQTCLQKFILSRSEAPHCFSCRKEYSDFFLETALSKTFRQGQLREHHKELLWEREKSLLPQTQPLAVARKNEQQQTLFNTLTREATQLDAFVQTVVDQRLKLTKRLHTLATEMKLDMYRDETCQRLLRAEATNIKEVLGYLQGQPLKRKCTQLSLSEIDEDPIDTEKVVRESKRFMTDRMTFHAITVNVDDPFLPASCSQLRSQLFPREAQAAAVIDMVETTTKTLCPCPNNECRGFCDSHGVCSMCSTKLCLRCWAQLKEGHECSEANIATKELILRDCKPCPKCSTFIHRTHGCDHMWCVSCKTGFNWRTLAIISDKQNTNPLLAAWEQERGVDACFEDVHTARHMFLAVMRNFSRVAKDRSEVAMLKEISNVIRILTSNLIELRRDNANIDEVFQELRVKYLCKELDEESFKSRVLHEDRQYKANCELQQSMEFFLDSVGTLCTKVINETDQQVVVDTMDGPRKMFNECVKSIALRHYAKVKVAFVDKNLIGEDWSMEGHSRTN